jgi:hypothetical protein
VSKEKQEEKQDKKSKRDGIDTNEMRWHGGCVLIGPILSVLLFPRVKEGEMAKGGDMFVRHSDEVEAIHHGE